MDEENVLEKCRGGGKTISCYIYGIGMRYNILSSYLKVYQDRIRVLALVTTEPQRITYLDGKKVIRPWEMDPGGMDYVIVAMQEYKEVFGILKKMGLSDRIIRSDVFSVPNFVLEDYLRLRESRPTILSNTCLAGFVYHDLGLKMLSPTVNVRCKNYISFLKDYKYYLSKDMAAMEKEVIPEDLCKDSPSFAPRGYWGGSLYWQFPHVDKEEEGVETWNRRRRYVNFDNVIALMIVLTDDQAYEFERLPIKKKLGFYYKDLNLPSILYTPEWNDTATRNRYAFRYQDFIHTVYARNTGSVCRVDWIRFLNGEGGFLRF